MISNFAMEKLKWHFLESPDYQDSNAREKINKFSREELARSHKPMIQNFSKKKYPFLRKRLCLENERGQKY